MRILDLFCCAGGAGMGYHQAGFDVTGIDIDPQPDYPFPFHQADALEYVTEHGHEYDAIHASPPCQGYTTMGNRNRLEWPKLITPLRAILETTGRLWVIENVPGARADMRHPILLHGGIFGLGVDRPRLFETNAELLTLPMGPRVRRPVGVYGKLDGRRLWTRNDGTELRAAADLKTAQEAMGIDWMDWDHLREAIPPAYTEWIGAQLATQIREGAA